MNEKELISKIQKLRQIEPRKDWVSLTKTRILSQESVADVGLLHLIKPAFAGFIAVFVLIGLFGFAQNSVPGDFLYPMKKITERGQAVFVSEIDKPQASLELVNKRLEELTKIAETNQVKKLAPAINEFQASVSEAAKNLSRLEATSSDPVAGEEDKSSSSLFAAARVIKKIVEGTQKLEENKQRVEALGVVLGGEELNELQEVSDKLEVKLVNLIISDLENRILTEEQAEILNQIKELVEGEKYSEALELYLINQ